MRKILFILSTELSAYQMLTYMKEKNKKYEIDLLIPIDSKNLYKHKKNRVFKSISRKSFFINEPSRPITFNITKFWNCFFAYKNREISKKIHSYLKKIYFNIDDYDEVFFSNDYVSHYVLYNSQIKKTYFDHSPIDTLLKIELNFFKKIKSFLECLINNKFMNIYYKGNGNFFQKSIFSNFLKKKSKDYSISIKIFKNIFSKFNKEKVKKISNRNYNLINFYIPYYAFDVKYSNTILKNYKNFFIENTLKKIFLTAPSNDVFLFKFRQSIPIKFQKNLINHIKKIFPNKNIILVNKEFPKMINLEKIIYNFNIKRYFTSYSSSIFLTKALNPKIVIYEYGSHWSKFLNKNWNFFKHKNNYNNYLLASRLYRNIARKL